MKFLRTGVIALGLVGAAGLGAAFAPTAFGQSRVRPAEPSEVRVFTAGGSSRIGVSVSDLEASSGSSGVRIESVEENSPASKAGLQTGDIVVEFDGERVRSVRQFSRLVSETPPGRQVAAALTRDGKRMTVNITPEARGSSWISDEVWRSVEEAWGNVTPKIVRPPVAPLPPEPPLALFRGNQLGVTVNSLSDQLKEYFGVKDGVLVAAVTDDSLADKVGVKAGDVIVRLNDATIDTPAKLRQEVGHLDPGEEFTLEVMRDRKPVTLKGKTEERRPRRSTFRTIL